MPDFAHLPDMWQRCLTSFFAALYRRSQSKHTLRVYRLTLHAFFASPNPPENYTREDVLTFIHRPTQGGKEPRTATVNMRLAILSSFYRFASTFLVDGEPLYRGHSPTLGILHGKPARAYRALSYEEVDRLFAVIPHTVQGLRDRAVFLTYFWTARRSEEVRTLRYGDLSYGDIVSEDGTRREGWRYRFYGKGRGEQEDSAELPAPAKEAIDAYLAASGRLENITADEPLFISLIPFREKKPLSSTAISHALKGYAELAGLDPKRVTIHSWRHTAAQQRYAAGEDIRSLQRLLRHSSLAVTDIYLHGLMGTSDDGAKLLESRFARFSRTEKSD